MKRWLTLATLGYFAVICASSLNLSLQAADTPNSPKIDYTSQVHNVLEKYCVSCHNDKKKSAGLSLVGLSDEKTARKDRKLWDKIADQIQSREMPPEGKPQPNEVERKSVTDWVHLDLNKVDCGLVRDPGRPTLRRLNRNEYNNTIRDLVGVDFRPGDDFPADDVGYGFDNIGDVLSLPPILLEKYLTAAESVLDKAIVINRAIVKSKDTFRAQNLISTLGKESKQKGRIALTSNGAAIQQYDFQHDADYFIRVRASGDRAGTELPKLSIKIDRKEVKVFDVDATAGNAKIYEVRTRVKVGKQPVAAEFTNDFLDANAKDPKMKDRNLYIEAIEIEGPIDAKPKELPETHKRIFVSMPATNSISEKESTAAKILQSFMRRAFRRPVKMEETAKYVKLFRYVDGQGEQFERAIQIALRAVLVSPHFLFKVEKDPNPTDTTPHRLDPYEYATRISYFLWSSMPDEELFKMADDGSIFSRLFLDPKIKKMIQDPKAKAFTENFAGQWLQLRTLATATPDRETYPIYDAALKQAMIRETELFFENIVLKDRSIMEFLDSDYTFVNERLAKHYRIEGIKGSEFQQVKLTDKNRGGVLTQASILTLTSNPTRTSPVKRGKWILENILGTPPPPPDPNAPPLEEKAASSTASIREKMEQHRANAICASCHSKMDPLGFGLDNFDGVGYWRTYEGKNKIDASGVLPAGEKFDGPSQMRKVLLAKGDLFRRCLSEKLLTYALGRGLEYFDKCALDAVVESTKANGDRFSTLVLGIVNSEPFQKRRGYKPE
jgi:hypothetical protein